MRKAAILLMSATLLTGIGLTGSAVARDHSDRTELTASQMTDRAEVRTAKLKVDLNLTADQEKNWAGFATAMQDRVKSRPIAGLRCETHAHSNTTASMRWMRCERTPIPKLSVPTTRRNSLMPPSHCTRASTSNRRVALPKVSLALTVSATPIRRISDRPTTPAENVLTAWTIPEPSLSAHPALRLLLLKRPSESGSNENGGDKSCKQETQSSLGDRSLFGITSYGKRKSGQRRKRPGSCFLHDRGSMVFDGPLADPEISCDIFARVAGQNHFHDLVLPSREAREVISRILAPLRELPEITG